MSTSTVKSTKSVASKKLVKKPSKPTKVKEELPEEVLELEIPVKKVTKKSAKKSDDVEAPVKEVKEVKEVKKSSKSAKADKETLQAEEPVKKPKKAASKSKKDQDPPQEPAEEEEKKVKKAKKINNKPTLSDTCGLNLSVAKVKNIMSNLCINSEPFWALKEMKEHRVVEEEKTDPEGKVIKDLDENGKRRKRQFTFTLHGLSQQTLDYLERAHQNSLELARESHAKLRIKKMDEPTRKEYNLLRKEAVTLHQLDQKNGHLFQVHEFDSVKFNTQYNKDFYSDMEILKWKSLKNMELYAYCANLINKMKVRFNAESKIFITAFVEHIVKQMVVNGTVNCVNSGKRIIKLEHALDNISEGFDERFGLYPLISNLESYHKALSDDEEVHAETAESVETDENQDEAPNEEEAIDRKYQFKYYVSELCRTVKMELARADCPEDMSQSVYYHTSVSKIFKNFCSSIIVDLIRMFGEVLKVEVNTRNVKTVNYTIIQTLIQVAHLMYGLSSELDETVRFIQERYCVYQKFIEERKEKRGTKGAGGEEDEDEEEDL
jgi:hypothetical protein